LIFVCTAREHNGYVSPYDDKLKRDNSSSYCLFPTLPSSGKTKSKNPYDKEHLLELNKRVLEKIMPLKTSQALLEKHQ
ncbi:hypothetical protein RJ639_011587, partial [Escallonia herrerae]